MISKITLDNVASYKRGTSLETNKKINLIYGLNGVGKSTLSNYLYDPNNEKFNDCSIDGLDDETELLVYNQKFIQDNFYENKELKGIFTLSKSNGDAITKITDASTQKNKLENEKKLEDKRYIQEREILDKARKTATEQIWNIKSNYSGSDRVLEFCLEGLKRSKDTLFEYFLNINKPKNKPEKSIDDLKNSVQSLSGDNAEKYSEIPRIDLNIRDIEKSRIFQKQIVGNDNSTISALINKLGNSDWVREGQKYLSHENHDRSICPFCQENTINPKFINELSSYFDASFLEDQDTLISFYELYKNSFNLLPTKESYDSNPIFKSFKVEFETEYSKLNSLLANNIRKMENKIKTPSIPTTLEDSTSLFKNVNNVIDKVNLKIRLHNSDIENVDLFLKKIKDSFWKIMRWEYNSTIEIYNSVQKEYDMKTEPLSDKINLLIEKISEQQLIIDEQQKLTINVDGAIEDINNGLIDIGITDFKIKKYSNEFYHIVREIENENDENADFRSLSEGEKMIISFFYFIKLCDGKTNPNSSDKKKVVIIDDPISSLSNIFVFNIGRLIKNEFFGKKTKSTDDEGNEITEWKYKYNQLFLLTHSLYFFYEMTEINHDVRREVQKLFRIVKNSDGSSIISMKYEEIQNDYQSYWSIIKNETCPPALIANCMRNIIEYFFNFVEKKDLNNFFNNNPSLKKNKYQAFYRFINRESHSLGQNIFDFKEFNYSDFREAFRLVFFETGYQDHYKKMIK